MKMIQITKRKRKSIVLNLSSIFLQSLTFSKVIYCKESAFTLFLLVHLEQIHRISINYL